MASQGITSEHRLDENGNPAGGTTTSRGITIEWQNGPLGRCSCPTDWPADEDGNKLTPKAESRARQVYHSDNCERKEPNGAFVEDVIHTALDRLNFYQGGEFASAYNDLAIDHLEAALEALSNRTADREGRGVEGTHQP